ncbi:MAG: hypothetical protein ACYDH6_09125 [Acidimicrobiales bacterium]
MRKAVFAVVASGMLGTSAFLMTAQASPTYSSPCGASQETGPAPKTPTLIGIPPAVPPGTSGEVGIIGPDGYLEAVGSASGPSGHVSGATSPSRPSVYGSIGNDAGGPKVCVGSGTTTVHVP